MLSKCIDIFIDNYDEKELIDNIKLKEGYYALVTKDCNGLLIFDKKNTLEVNKDIDSSSPLYRKIAEYDYYSNILKNKPIVSRSGLLSCNYYTAFTKGNVVNSKKISQEILDSYYDTLQCPEEYYKDKQRELYKYIIKENMVKNIDSEELIKIKEFMKKEYFKIIDVLKTKYNYKNEPLKVFKVYVETNVDNYKREFNRYYYVNCFATAESILYKNNIFYGAPAIDFTLNEDKPFLRTYSRKEKQPAVVKFKNALNATLFKRYLQESLALKYKHYYFNIEKNEMHKFKDIDFNNEFFNEDFSGIYLKYEKTCSDSNNISCLENIVIEQKKSKKMLLKNTIFKISENYEKLYKEYKSKGAILNVISFICFDGTLSNKKDDDFKISGKLDYPFIKIRDKYKDIIYAWIFKQNNTFESIYKNMFKELINKCFDNNYNAEIRLPNILNLYFALNKYFGGKDMQKNNIENKKALELKLASESEFTFNNDEEFYFALGHISKYLVYQNESSKNRNMLFKPLLSTKAISKYVKNIFNLYNKYLYKLNGKNFEKLLNAIVSYNPISKEINKAALVSGYTSDNILFKKKKENNKNLEVEENE